MSFYCFIFISDNNELDYMKKIINAFLYLSICILLTKNAKSQLISVFNPAPPGTTSITVSPGDFISFNIDNQGIPPHCCNPTVRFLIVEFDVILINSATSVSYNIGTFAFYAVGANCTSSGDVYDFFDETKNIPVPECLLPNGNYWLALKLNSTTDDGSGCPVIGGVLKAFDQVAAVTNTVNPGGIIYNVLQVDVINSNTFTTVNLTKLNKTCLNDGSLTATPIDGTGPYTYSWNNGGNTDMIENLDDGNYTVTVTDANGCEVVTSEIITEPYVIDLSSNIIQEPCTFDEGSIFLNPTGGVPPYTFNWSSGEITQNIEQLLPGNYNIIVTDADGCQGTESFALSTQYQATDFDYPWGINISATNQALTDYDGDNIITIRGRMTIDEGVNYSITGKTLEFADNIEEPWSPDLGLPRSGIVIKKNAKLTFNNSTATAVSGCSDMWDGIQVWGGQPLQPSPSNIEVAIIGANDQSIQNGKLILKNSTVSNAHIGVALYRTLAPFSQQPTIDYGRGIIEATNSQFINNRTGIAFSGKTLINNYSFIKGCKFINNATMNDIYSYNNEGMNSFISLSKVKKVKITASEFNGNIMFTEENRGTAIYSYDASFTVESGTIGNFPPQIQLTPNKFNNLTKGIDAYSTGGINKNIRVRDNRFNNVQQGIIANGTSFDEISFNEFEIPEGTAGLNTCGVFLYSTYGFLVTENTFNTSSTNIYTYGLLAHNTNVMAGEVYHNDYTGAFEVATQMELDNSLLQVKCNDYTNTNTYDWAVTSGNLANQGFCSTDPTSPAGNRFDPCFTSDESQIFVDPSASAFNYSTQSDIAPICISPSITEILCSGLFIEADACPVTVDIPCGIPCIAERKVIFDETPPGFTKELIKSGLFRAMENNEDIVGLLEILATNASDSDLRLLIATYLSYGQCQQAQETLERLSGTGIPDIMFKQLYTVLIQACEDGRTEKELTASEKQTVRDISLITEQFSVHAQSVLTKSDNEIYIREPEKINSNRSFFDENTGNESTNENTGDLSSLKVYPNPINENATIEFATSNETGATKIIVYDVLGKAIKTIAVSGNKGTVFINNEELQQGTYYCVLFNEMQALSKTIISVIK